MNVQTRGPVSAASLLWKRGPGWVLTVICKAAFDLIPGEAQLRASPAAPADHDVPWDNPYSRSLRATTDLVPLKANVDILLTGYAYAPAGHPVRSLVARLVIGDLDKSIEVVGDRYFNRAGTLLEGPAFARMPLVYERAAGGPSTWNLAGWRVGQRDAQGNIPLPNLLPPGTQIVSADQLFIAPTGFGPLPADWPSRVEKLGSRSPRDIPLQWNGQEVPDDIAPAYFNSAPPDQQIEVLRDDSTILLENLHGSHPSLISRLPGLRPWASCEVAGQTATIGLRTDTLHIDTDHDACVVVWRGHLPLRDPREVGRIMVELDVAPPRKRSPTFTGMEAVPAVSPPRTTAPGPSPEVEAALETTMMLAPALAALTLPGSTRGAPPAPSPLSQSSASWDAAQAPSPLSQSSASWETQGNMRAQAPPPPPRASNPGVPPKRRPSFSGMEAVPAVPPPPPRASNPGAPPKRSPTFSGMEAVPAVPPPPPRASNPGAPPKRSPTFSGMEAVPAVPPPPPRASNPGASPEAETALEAAMTLAPRLESVSLPFVGPTKGAPPTPSPLSQSSASWEAVRAPSPLSQSSASWETRDPMATQPPPPLRPAEQSSPSWKALVPQQPLSSRTPSGSWEEASAFDSPPTSARPGDIPRPPAAAPPPPPPAALRPMPPPALPLQAKPPSAVVSTSVLVAQPAMTQASVPDSPWATGGSAKRETIGMQTATGAHEAAPAAMPPAAVPEARPRTAPREVLKLLWFDPRSVARIRRHAEWRILLAELELRLLDQDDHNADEASEGDDGESNSAPRRDVFEVLVKGRPVSPDGVKLAMSEAIDDDGKFEPPLILLAGELELPFDQLATLKAIASAASPFAMGDKKLKEQLDVTEELLKTPWLQGSGSIAEGLTEKIKEAFAQGKRPVGPDYLTSHAERILLEQRCYQMRTVFGKRWIRSLLGANGVPVYVPEALKDELPMFKRVKVKMIGEVDMQEDQYESGGCAIKVLALGRVMG